MANELQLRVNENVSWTMLGVWYEDRMKRRELAECVAKLPYVGRVLLFGPGSMSISRPRAWSIDPRAVVEASGGDTPGRLGPPIRRMR